MKVQNPPPCAGFVIYLSNVKLLKQKGERFVSSTQISKEINIDASAKDLSYVNISDVRV